MNKPSHPLSRMVPSKETLEAFFRSIFLAGNTYEEDFGWSGEKITVTCYEASERISSLPNLSHDRLKEELDRFFNELCLSLPEAVRFRDHIECGTALAHLCFLSSMALQLMVLDDLQKRDASTRPRLSGWEMVLCYELVALWRLMPWYVSAINAAMPVMDFPISDQTEEIEDVKSDSRSLLEPSA